MSRMSAWGPGPFESDDGSELASDLEALVAEALYCPGYEYNPYKIRAAAQFLIEVPYFRSVDHLSDARNRLTEVLDDKEWIASWYRPPTIRRALRKQLAQIEDLLQKQYRKDARRSRK